MAPSGPPCPCACANVSRVTRHVSRVSQDHTAADKIAKIQKDLDETKIILHQTIDSVLKRGEKLDALVDKSNDLSLASQMFYKQAKKTNSCCRLM